MHNRLDIAILSDSRTAIRALASCEVKSKMVCYYLGKLNQLKIGKIRLLSAKFQVMWRKFSVMS